MSNFNELKQLPLDQLEVLIEDLGKEIYQLKNQLAMNRKLDKPHLIKDKKKDRARAMLVLAEKTKKEAK